MPRRPDGRIEPGQKLASAISARAWNRAQDAADIVLGERTGFGAEAGPGFTDRLFKTVGLSGTVHSSNRRGRFGMIVNHQSVNTPASTALTGQRPPTTTGRTLASLFVPVPFVDRRQTANRHFGVICDGRIDASSSVTICTHGTCLAMVRKNPGGFLPRVRPAVIRYASDTAINLRGIAEDSDCGAGELIYWTNIKPYSEAQQVAEGIDPVEPIDNTLDNVYYAVVRL
jgi:hypothetical protein